MKIKGFMGNIHTVDDENILRIALFGSHLIRFMLWGASNHPVVPFFSYQFKSRMTLLQALTPKFLAQSLNRKPTCLRTMISLGRITSSCPTCKTKLMCLQHSKWRKREEFSCQQKNGPVLMMVLNLRLCLVPSSSTSYFSWFRCSRPPAVCLCLELHWIQTQLPPSIQPSIQKLFCQQLHNLWWIQ